MKNERGIVSKKLQVDKNTRKKTYNLGKNSFQRKSKTKLQ